MAVYEVADRSAIVTGGGSGIGKAASQILARSGAAVLVADLKEEAAQAVVGEIQAEGGTAAALAGDVADPDFAVAAVEAASKLGPLRIAVNNAGIGGPAAPVADYDLDAWKKVIEINQNAVFYGLRAQIPAIIAAGGGSIVNIASILGSVGFAQSSAYVTSKHAVVGLTKNAALEYATQGVRVNAVGPGFIRTPLVEASLDADALTYLESQHAFGRLGEPDEVGHLIAFLASDAASFITGSYHLADGGYTAR